MNSRRRGIALPAAIVAITALSAIAALSTVAARIAFLEASAVRDEARADITRLTLRARLAHALSTSPRGHVLGAAVPLGGHDTALAVTSLTWPWHRVAVVSDGHELVAEFAHARTPPPPWCAAVVAADLAGLPGGAVQGDPHGACDSATAELPAELIEAWRDSLSARLVVVVVDTVRLSVSSGPAQVVLARALVEIAPGVQFSGLVVATDVRLGEGAGVRGAVAAAGSITASPGSWIQGDRLVVSGALASSARLELLGRRGLLRSP